MRGGASLLAFVFALGVAQAQTDAPTPNSPGATTTQIDPIADEQTEADVVVVGTAQGERKAIDAKRLANNFTETLYANDVGKLPDQNVAEAVRRLPGLSVANDQGEGRTSSSAV